MRGSCMSIYAMYCSGVCQLWNPVQHQQQLWSASKMFRSRKRGQFVSTKVLHRAASSSARLKLWHQRHNVNTSINIKIAPEITSTPVPAYSQLNNGAQEDIANGKVTQPTIVGRRIVEFQHLIQQMNCKKCNDDLNLINIQKETKYGFGSVLQLLCTTCGTENHVDTNKRLLDDGSHKRHGPLPFSINTKAALGMIHSGLGYRHIKSFMSSMEVPAPHHTVIKKNETKVGLCVRSVAKKSCTTAIKQEIAATRKVKSSTTTSADVDCQNETETSSIDCDVQKTAGPSSTGTASWSKDVLSNNDSLVDITYKQVGNMSEKPVSAAFKYDMGWQKRGSGRSYDSKSGVGTVIGNETGKICAYDIRVKTCKLCDVHKHKGEQVPIHNCQKNWYGSSKSMEPDVGGQLVKEIEQENVEVGVIIMDDDSTTHCRIKQELSHNVEKWSDTNHTAKNLAKRLFSLQTKHSSLSTKVVKDIQKSFNYAVAQNKGNVEKCKAALSQVVPHAFGEHESCGTWCRFASSKSPQKVKHHGLPHGKSLSGESLRADLDAVLNSYITNVSKIAPGASTKDVESVNNMVSSKAPKRMHYSSSDSLGNRVSCVVAQKNIGNTYINEVNSLIGASPGQIFESHAVMLDTLRKRRRETEQTVAFKRRRLQKKLAQKCDNAKMERKEGITYQSGIGNSLISEVKEIPKPETLPMQEKLKASEIANSQKVFCDIETTSLHKTADIVQISAVSGADVFNIYILPERSFAPSASNVTGLQLHDGDLFYLGKRVDTVALKKALTLFLGWLDTHQPCILIGHNFHKFDFPRIFRSLEISRLAEGFENCILGIVDTLPLFKTMFPNLEKYSQPYLFTYFVKEQYSAHNALSDVKSLQKLCETVGISSENMSDFSFSSQSAIKRYFFHKAGEEKAHSLLGLQQSKALTKTMAEKIASSGLSLQHLKFAAGSGMEGLTQVFSECVHGKPRVTKCKRVIESVFNAVK